MKIYIVCGHSGEYDSTSRWIVCARTSPEKAQEKVDELTKALAAIGLNEFSYPHNYGEAMLTLDPNYQDGRKPMYFFVETELVE